MRPDPCVSQPASSERLCQGTRKLLSGSEWLLFGLGGAPFGHATGVASQRKDAEAKRKTQADTLGDRHAIYAGPTKATMRAHENSAWPGRSIVECTIDCPRSGRPGGVWASRRRAPVRGNGLLAAHVGPVLCIVLLLVGPSRQTPIGKARSRRSESVGSREERAQHSLRIRLVAPAPAPYLSPHTATLSPTLRAQRIARCPR